MQSVDSMQMPRRRGRPPKQAPYARHDARAHLIRVGIAVLTEKGYSSAGLDEILRLSKIPKGSFYHYFASKEAFGQVLISQYAEYFAHKLDRWLLDESTKPLQRLQHFIKDAKEGMATYDYKRGCLVGNLGQEMGSLPESFRLLLEQVFVDWQNRTAICLTDAQKAREISARHDCLALAKFFWIGWEGAVLRAKLSRSPSPLDLYADGFFDLLNT